MDDLSCELSRMRQLEQRRATLAVLTSGTGMGGDPPSDEEAVSASSSRRSSRAVSAIVLKNDLLLHEAVIKNDPDAVRKILKEPVDVNCRNNYGRAPIHWAASRGATEIMELLIAAKCDIEAKDKYGMRPLLMAAWHGQSDAVRMLINCGASVNATNKKDLSLLMCGARNNRLSVVNLILETLEEPNLEDADAEQQTALYHAALSGHAPVVDRLIQAGASTRANDKHGRTPLHAAAERGHEEAVRTLLKHGADPASQDDNGNTPLHVAAENQQSNITQELLVYGVNPDIENSRGFSALHVASGLGCRGIIDSLLQSGAQINKQSKDGSSPLHVACLQNQLAAIEQLIAKGADTNSLDVRLQSPMHIAAERGYTEACKLLLTAGAAIDQKEQSGKTPLYMAARGSFTAIVDMIIKTARLDCPVASIEDAGADSSSDVSVSQEKEKSVSNQELPESLPLPRLRKWRLSIRDSRDPHQVTGSGVAVAAATGAGEDRGNGGYETPRLLRRLAHRELAPHDWRKLARHWKFTDDQVRAIEHQYTGPASYKEHGHRLLLIWRHSLDPECNFLSELADSLSAVGKEKLAETVRKKQQEMEAVGTGSGPGRRLCSRCSPCILT